MPINHHQPQVLPNPHSPNLPVVTHLARLHSANNRHWVQRPNLLRAVSVLMRMPVRAHLRRLWRRPSTRNDLLRGVVLQLSPANRAPSVLVFQIRLQAAPLAMVEEHVHLVPLRLYSVNLRLPHYKTNLHLPHYKTNLHLPHYKTNLHLPHYKTNLHLPHYKTSLQMPLASSKVFSASSKVFSASRQCIHSRLLVKFRVRPHRCLVRYQLNRRRLRLYPTLLTHSMVALRSTHSRV